MSERDSWQYRAIERTKGNSTPLGALLLAVLGRNAKNPPWFGSTAEITENGLVVTSLTTKDRRMHFPHVVGDVAFLTSSFSELADDLKLSDPDRIELFRLVRQWCSKDHRANIRLEFTGRH